MLHESCGMKNQCLYILRYTVQLYILFNSICCRHNGHHRLIQKQTNKKTINKTDCICSVYGICTQPRGTAVSTALDSSFYFFLCWKSFAMDFVKRQEARTKKYWRFNRLSPLSAVICSYSHMSSYICMQACILFFTLYVAACSGRLQCWGDNGRGCVRGCTCNCLLSQ